MSDEQTDGADFARAVGRFGSELLDFLVGAPCLVCGRRLDDGYLYYCELCRNPAADFDTALCGSCRSPVIDIRTGCTECRAAGPIGFLWACGAFDDFYRPIVHGIKYNGLYPLAGKMGALLSERICESGGEREVDVVIPIPLHWTRQRQRGFNQSEKIATAIGLRLDIPVRSDILVRKKITRDQTGLTSDERQVNMRGAFGVRKKDRIEGKRVLLIDDVTTTGATLSEAARELTGAGCEKTFAGVIAVAMQ